MSIETNSRIDELIARQKEGYSLEQPFYNDPDIFKRDMQRVLHKQWLLVDHVSRIPNAGDYFIVEIAGDEIIINRDREDNIHAHFNTCRHRGSKVCLNKEGNANSFTCPYHAWNYNLDGSLRGAPLMPEDFDKSTHGLHKCHVHVYDGLIFVCLSEEEPVDFESEYSCMQPHMDLHGLENAKVINRHQWRLKCNWKLVLENFFECYHCVPSHPELSKIHSIPKYRAFGSGPTSSMPEAYAAFEPELNAWKAKAEPLGYCPEWVADDENSLSLKTASRLPINVNAGHVSETKDGKPASTLMGKFTEYDGATTAISFNPFGTLLMPNDYAMIFRFTPISPEETDVEIVWLVDKDAQEGVDYDKENVSWLWHHTTIEDGDITEWNHAGVMSSRYQPGPYSLQEQAIATIGKWYLRLVK